MIYLIIGLTIMLMIIIISSIRASNKSVEPLQTLSEPDEPEYIKANLYDINVNCGSTESKLHDVMFWKDDGDFLVFRIKNDETVAFRKSNITSYNIKKTGSFKRKIDSSNFAVINNQSVKYV